MSTTIVRATLAAEQEQILRELNRRLQPLFHTGAATYRTFEQIGKGETANAILAPLTAEARERFLSAPVQGEQKNDHQKLGARLETLTHRTNMPVIDAAQLATALVEAYGCIDPAHTAREPLMPTSPSGSELRALITQAFALLDLPLSLPTAVPGLEGLSTAVAQARQEARKR